MRLTTEQVLENNTAARKILNEIVPMLKVMERRRELKKEAQKYLNPFQKIIAFFATDPHKVMKEMDIEHALKVIKMKLEMYFHFHYTSSGELTHFMSPDVSFTTEHDRILWTTVYKHTLPGIPHIVK